MTDAALQIAVVGHTNTGKTSLLRTLTRETGFGVVSARSASTRDVAGVALLCDGAPMLSLFDTPGLEDASGVAEALAALPDATDPVAGIERFLAGDHGQGRWEQEAKVLRQMLRSDAALYVIDAREPVQAKHRDELRLLNACGRPLMPVLNFVASDEADVERWRSQLARMGLHVQSSFDTVVYDAVAEQALFDKLATLLEPHRAGLQRLTQSRTAEREALTLAACRAVAVMLVEVAGLRHEVPLDADPATATEGLRHQVRASEQRCVDAVLALFQFDLQAYHPPELPLTEGRWTLDPLDPEALRAFGIRTGSAAATGGAAGFAVDAALGGMSLGAATALGAGLGAAWSGAQTFGRPWLDRLRGHQVLVADPSTLALLAARQVALLRALLRRGHAAEGPVSTRNAQGWPGIALRDAVLRARHSGSVAEASGTRAPNEADVSAVTARLITVLGDTARESSAHSD
ncbi:GTPase/DUF3482 domain-containing protein [Polycyclovorans algicola]|uniref:GTPase/DUF3482 domain-containing protein n=1 Tax=Polycyclovorans algicola TaxID=616992 RepID=UPI000693402D|nr:GTPase/DUF3482 domain-containing protein [Polycyclovorans algicola]